MFAEGLPVLVWGVMFDAVACTLHAVSECVMGCSDRVSSEDMRRALTCLSNCLMPAGAVCRFPLV